MASPAVLTVRPAQEKDRNHLTHLLHFETYVHRHLDWRQPVDWLGDDPYLVIERGGRILAALVCPPDPREVAWIRLFACSSRLAPSAAWEHLWPVAREYLVSRKAEQAVALPLNKWFKTLLETHDFEHAHNVVVLDWLPDPDFKASDNAEIHRMTENDLPGVHAVDNEAFPALWRNSLQAVELAFKQAAYSSVIELDGRVAAYQISTPSSQGLHLARLAVHPDFQGRRLAFALGEDVKQRAARHQMNRLTVNTQTTNLASLGLYKKLGFEFTGEEFQVYSQTLDTMD
jgi:ribosomal protein S18 acetylase RimI-like enzyme